VNNFQSTVVSNYRQRVLPAMQVRADMRLYLSELNLCTGTLPKLPVSTSFNARVVSVKNSNDRIAIECKVNGKPGHKTFIVPADRKISVGVRVYERR
jgi:hypothetical protein